MANEDKLLKPYDPKATEERIYKLWEESGYFNPDNLPERHKEPFSIVLPPPNVTGTLHMGSALMLAVQDIMVRYARMQGKKTLWLPGMDHAAIATQSKVEKIIQKEEGKNRYDIGREELLRRIEEFAKANREVMVQQINAMGASVDWSREAFTLDKKRNLAVRTVFKKMYDDGLIYRGHRIVNWDPKGQTTISDDEIVYEERPAKLYTFKYSPDFPIAISTTRPETKVGDSAVAVHPEDARYKYFVGKEYDVGFCGVDLHIKIVGDPSVDPEFGTGALGVTPAHSMVDWEIAERHGLPNRQVINEFAKMTAEAGPRLAGKKTTEAREEILGWLRENNLLQKQEDINQNVATAERTGGIIEPLPKLQWFVAVNKPVETRGGKTLKELMHDPVATGEIKIMPDHEEKKYFNWIKNLRDWCISRQIWYGHRIPVWYKGNEIYVGVDAPEGEGWRQDEDTLDTWFSSGLWTFSTLGWPEQTADFKNYHPTDVLETGYDILFFWVARMILMAEYALGTIPFRTVYLHGLVRDAKGQKISKSLGNNIDPLDMIRDYGADASRMSLIVGTGPGNDSKFLFEKIGAYKKFANKLWNIARFVITNTKDTNLGNRPELEESDQRKIDETNKLVEEITTEMDEYKFYIVAEKVYHYIWHTLADKYIEEFKPKLAESESAQWTLKELFATSLQLLHPFMPFVTEEIWGIMRNRPAKPTGGAGGDLLMIEPWPTNSRQ